MNHGVLMTPGVDEEWTLSVLHGDADVARYIEVLEVVARDATGA
jgi:glutamate-1-semialdehyde 2,1-aminomutase